MSKTHTIVAFIAQIIPDRVTAINDLLRQIESDPANNEVLPFAGFKSVHFASLTICEGHGSGQQSVSELILEVNSDDGFPLLLSTLAEHAGIRLIFSYCAGYPQSSPKQLPGYLRSKAHFPNAWHIGNTNRRVSQILDEHRLYEALQTRLDLLRPNPECPMGEKAIADDLKAYARVSFPWLKMACPSPNTLAQQLGLGWLLAAASLAAVILVGLAWKLGLILPLAAVVVTLLIGAGIYIIVLLRHEHADDREIAARGPLLLDPRHAMELGNMEDFGLQNHLTGLIELKPGAFRRWTLWTVLFLVNIAARFSKPGELAGIPSIHFAHWALIDNGTRLLFLSNFDNSWGSYLDDFTDKAGSGLTGIWSNTRNFPHTHLLVKDGAADGARFKIWARMAQTPTRVHYRAYPTLSVANIERNSAIRAGLTGSNSGEEIKGWLNLF